MCVCVCVCVFRIVMVLEQHKIHTVAWIVKFPVSPRRLSLLCSHTIYSPSAAAEQQQQQKKAHKSSPQLLFISPKRSPPPPPLYVYVCVCECARACMRHQEFCEDKPSSGGTTNGKQLMKLRKSCFFLSPIPTTTKSFGWLAFGRL